MNRWHRGWQVGLSAVIALSGSTVTTAMAQTEIVLATRPENGEFIRPPVHCPTELAALVPLLLRDLPGYANRVNQRAYTGHLTTDVPGYVLVAGRPNHEPLPLTSRQFTPLQDDTTTQVFFTTLERQYAAGEAVKLQHYHWVFLTPTEMGWQLVMMFSTIGDVPANEPPTPPQNTSQGVIAQAMRLWLRDCQAGSIDPPASSELRNELEQ